MDISENDADLATGQIVLGIRRQLADTVVEAADHLVDRFREPDPFRTLGTAEQARMQVGLAGAQGVEGVGPAARPELDTPTGLL